MFESCRAHHRINSLGGCYSKTAHPITHPDQICRMNRDRVHCGHGKLVQTRSPYPPKHKGPTLVPPIDLEIQSVEPGLPRVEAPEGWVKKIDRAREGRVWVGYFHVWETAPDGQRVRRKKEKTLGPATKPKHEALNDLAEYIAERTGKLAKQGESISTFAELWKAFCAVKSGQWSKKTKENLKCLFAKHVIPKIGSQRMGDVTLTPLQLLLNKLAEDGFSKSAVGQIRTYVKGCFEYAVDEDLIPKSPARKLVMPKIRKKPCERFLSVEEFRGHARNAGHPASIDCEDRVRPQAPSAARWIRIAGL
jgi:hypothetical protein